MDLSSFRIRVQKEELPGVRNGPEQLHIKVLEEDLPDIKDGPE
jgi:hypothetical protein